MSQDNNNPDPFDFNFDSLNTDEPLASTGDSSFDLDNPFGDDVVVSRNNTSTEGTPISGSESSFDLGASDSGVSADNPYLNAPPPLNLAKGDSQTGEDSASGTPAPEKKKKGFLGGLFGGKGKKGKETPEPKEKEPKVKKEKVKKEKAEKKPKEPTGPREPRDWGTILCLGIAGFLALNLLVINVAAFLSAKEIMPLLLFLGTINLVGLTAISVPLLFLRADKKDRTLTNVMLGVSVVVLFGGLMIMFTEFYQYSFIVKP